MNSNESSVDDREDSSSTQQVDTENIPENTAPALVADNQVERNDKPQAVLKAEQKHRNYRQDVHSHSLLEETSDANEEEQRHAHGISEEHKAEVSPHEREVHDDSDVQEESPDKDGELLQTKLTSIDLGDQQLTQDEDAPSTGRASSTEGDVKKSGRSRSRSHRRARTRPYSVDTDALNDYVSSEKVGMRATGTFVGRGPAPLRNYSESMVTRDWMSAPPPPTPGEEADEDSERGVEGYEPASGASLLEADEDPLQLPAHDSPRSPGDRKRAVFGNKSVTRRYPHENGRRDGDPTLFSWKSMFPRSGNSETAEVSVEVNQSDDMQTPSQGAVFGAEEQKDDWELYRGNDERASSPPEFKPLEALDEEGEQNDSDLRQDSDEQERLRAWRMSAQEASSIVRR
ncbi:hypothetical protein BWQ96_06536 [Gracilariopsis chorda]|uniref:Uncharacterized protein n=1 Tax=Gracilariopsis chorda TaxID=448386 RepID=A0A2V3INP9_9FLOR|nr:hypothetical protein BWQ96_06536 [Gracilariopsis chorda]|eukprot:PXF43706.1 hypothetical protein BWQ96_06536 [Gracilariopsis chorda]